MARKCEYEVVRFNDRRATATQNLLSGRPDVWDRVSTHCTLKAAVRAAKSAQRRLGGRVAIRQIGERFPLPGHENYFNIVGRRR